MGGCASAPAKPANATLVYFGLGARGFVARVCMRKSGVQFEDKRVEFPQWAEYPKDTLPLGQLPALEVEGKTYCQSVAISRYAAQLSGLYPCDNPLQALQSEEIVAIIDEMWNKGGSTPKEQEAREKYGKEVAPKYLLALAKRLGDKKFFGGEEPNWADLWMYQYTTFFTSGFFDFLPKDFVAVAAPAIAKHAEAVKASELYKKFGTPE